MSIPAEHISNWVLHLPGTFSLDASFGAPSDWDPKDKCLIDIQADGFAFQNQQVPELEFPTPEARLKQFYTVIVGASKEKKPMKFKFIINYHDSGKGLGDVILENMGHRIIAEHERNPLVAWCKDSQNKHQLRGGNIFPADELPFLSRPNMVLSIRRTHPDRLSLKIPMVYAAYDELQHESGLAAEYASSPFQAAFMPIPGSAIKLNVNDNALPNMYLCKVRWASDDLDRPKEGDQFEVDISCFTLPECPVNNGPKKLKPKSPASYNQVNVSSDEGDDTN